MKTIKNDQLNETVTYNYDPVRVIFDKRNRQNWYDAQGREIRRDAYGLNSNKTFVETVYNARGEVVSVTEPFFTTKTYAAIYTYDSYGRISNVVTPMGTTVYAYSGLTTTFTSPTGTSSTTINPAGWVMEEETNGKKVNFARYASGLVKTATPQNGLKASNYALPIFVPSLVFAVRLSLGCLLRGLLSTSLVCYTNRAFWVV